MPSNLSEQTKWKGIVNDFQKSGLSQAQYARNHSLAVHQLHYWKGKFKNESLHSASFAQVVAVSPRGNDFSRKSKICLTRDGCLEFFDDISVDWLVAFIRKLG